MPKKNNQHEINERLSEELLKVGIELEAIREILEFFFVRIIGKKDGTSTTKEDFYMMYYNCIKKHHNKCLKLIDECLKKPENNDDKRKK